MRLNGKLAIDHYIGGPLAWLLNLASSLVSPLIRQDHSLTRAPNTVLFLKFLGLGSIARAAFLLKATRQKYPDTKIVFATFPGCAPLVELYPEIDEVVVVREKRLIWLAIDTFKLLCFCWKNRIDLLIDLEVHSKYSSIVTALSLARDRAGFSGMASRFRTGLYSHLVYWNPTRFVGEAYRQLGAAIKLPTLANDHIPTIPEAAQSELTSFISKLELAKDSILIGINANASDLRLERRWPLESYAALMKILVQEPRVKILILGSPSEADYAEKLLHLSGAKDGRAVNVAGKLGFSAYLGLLGKLDLLLTNDSGPMHMASVFKTPMVSLWGPTAPDNYAPLYEQHRMIYQPIYCSPCTHFIDIPPCRGDNQCLKQISPSKVASHIAELLNITFDTQLSADIIALSPRKKLVYGYLEREE